MRFLGLLDLGHATSLRASRPPVPAYDDLSRQTGVRTRRSGVHPLFVECAAPCERAQGHLFSMPVSEADFVELPSHRADNESRPTIGVSGGADPRSSL